MSATVRRIATGVSSHFRERVLEWVMLFPTFGMGVVLLLQPGIFDVSPSFSELARVGTAAFWAYAMLICAAVRFVALLVNGTFSVFQYSPHLRLAAVFICGLIWFEFAYGFLIATLGSGGASTGVVAYATLFLLEAVNAFYVAKDYAAKSRR